MDEQDLRSLLERLHTEIECGKPVSEQDRELLRHLGADIDALLSRSGAKPPQADASIINRLEGSIDQFEATHTSLTVVLNQMLAILSNAGI